MVIKQQLLRLWRQVLLNRTRNARVVKDYRRSRGGSVGRGRRRGGGKMRQKSIDVAEVLAELVVVDKVLPPPPLLPPPPPPLPSGSCLAQIESSLSRDLKIKRSRVSDEKKKKAMD